ncbi:hypothetical protein BKA70DRAFT_1306834 [Coprinopsis sp. MPI-PUGE-AT-0042]|nr:hypothetical protein BKA70DRAFT_1306834 [Coprinopsis sp. MPI-PUGE-AT-0042]
MHRALDVPELLDLICSQFSASFNAEVHDRRSLVNLSRTCRRFSQPATEALWSNLRDLQPLFDMMGDDLWSWRDTGYSQGNTARILKREVMSKDVNSFKTRASRVVELSLTLHSQLILILGAIQSASRYEDHPLFPKLRSVHLTLPTSQSEDISALRLFLGPNVSSFHLVIPKCTYAQLSLLTALSHQCRGLSDLVLVAPISPTSLTTAILNWQSLRSVALPYPTRGLIEGLSHMPNLNGVNLTLHPLTLQSEVLSSGGFLKLRKLILRCDEDISPSLFIIKALRKSPLQELHLSSTTTSPLAMIASLNALLPTHVEHSSLKLFSLIELRPDDTVRPILDEEEAEKDDACNIEGLRHFQNLEVISIHLDTPLATGMPPLRQLAHHLTRLRSLDIGAFGQYAYPSVPKVNLGNLAEILQLFPHLTDLSIPIDGRDVTGGKLVKGPPHSLFFTLHVGVSPIESAQDVANLLSELLTAGNVISSTNIETLSEEGVEEASDPWDEKWIEADQILQDLIESRQEGG